MGIKFSIENVCRLVAENCTEHYGFQSEKAQQIKQNIIELQESVLAAGIVPEDWTSAWSIGKGNLATVMWVTFLPPGQKTSDGIYVSICFGKKGNGVVAGCAISDTKKKKYNRLVRTVDRGECPCVDVNGVRPGTKYNNGYLNPKEFLVQSFDEEGLCSHLKSSVKLCQETLAEIAGLIADLIEPPPSVPLAEPHRVDRLLVALRLFREARKSSESSEVRYWIFSPGEQACRWDEMRDGGVMALSYSECGRDLREYVDEEAIRAEFKSSEGDDASYKNHVRALTDFLNVMRPGDLVFAKKGTKTFLGVGRVTGEYEFAANAPDYKHRRAVEWLKVETIERDDAVARKTLTDVTRYGDLVRELCDAYGIGAATDAGATDWGCQDVRDWFDAFTPEKLKEDFAYFRSRMLWSRRVQGAIGREYAHIDELGAVMQELKESPRPIGYYVSEEFAKKCPEGFGKSTATDFLMKFHPNEYISFTGNMMDALDFLGLWPKDVKREIDVCYNELVGAATRIRNRMMELEIGRLPEGKKPEADYLTVNEFLWWTNEHKNLIKEKIMANSYKKTEIKKVAQQPIGDFSDFIKELEKDVADAGLKYAPDLMKRFVCAQLAKPFVVLTGLSGSGKTKLAEAFTKWIGVENTVNIVPVGADWTNNEKLLGYPNALDSGKYVMPDTGVLKLMLDANENPDLPFFLILDEMNLSHVERYFADFLSTMESTDGIIELYDSGKRYAEDGREIPPSFKFPKNLFVIGTMNVDETTYMFSPKVLDRAQVIEFRVSEKEMADFLAKPGNPKIDDLAGKGAAYAKAFLDLAAERKTKDIGADEKEKFNELLIGKVDPKTKEYDGLFTSLAKLGAEFGYRSAIEMVIFIAYYLEACAYGKLTQSVDREKCLGEAIDAAVLQKLLPKLHGSLNRLGPVIDALIGKVSKPALQPADSEAEPKTEVAYPLTYEKLQRMKLRVEKNGFTSFAEA